MLTDLRVQFDMKSQPLDGLPIDGLSIDGLPIDGLLIAVEVQSVEVQPSQKPGRRVGQDRIYTPYVTVYLVILLPKIPYIHRIYMVLANPTRHKGKGCVLLSEPHIKAHKCSALASLRVRSARTKKRKLYSVVN